MQGKNLFAFSILLKMETLDKFHIAIFLVAINYSVLVSDRQLCSVTLFSEKMLMWFHAQHEQKILDSISFAPRIS